MKEKINLHITQNDNDTYFNQKMPTFRNGFCHKEKVAFDITSDEYDGREGFIKVGGKKVKVEECGGEWNISMFQ
jgi:hypothetical protein